MVLSTHLRGIDIVVTIFLTLILISGCSGTSVIDPVTVSGNQNIQNAIENSSQRTLWGYWNAYIPPSHDTIEFIPLRSSQIHMNARRFLEFQPCDNCLTLVNLEIDQAGNELIADIQITHPYAGLDRLTAFDVRTVIISDGSKYFPTLDATVPVWELGDFTLKNPDGFTRLWNTQEFAPGTGPFEILEYSQGNFASPGTFTGTVNPFINYSSGERFHFAAGSAITKELIFNLVPGGINFGYAIDASWEPPLVDPPADVHDFPASANALEPHIDACNISNPNLTDETGDEVTGEIILFDYQGLETIKSAEVECPEVWNGSVASGEFIFFDEFDGADLVTTDFTAVNELGAEAGTYFGLAKSSDTGQDYWLGDINHSYLLFEFEIEEAGVNPEITGEMIFVAPGEPDPMGTATSNAWLYDFETSEETMLTDFWGVGYIWHEPRINAQGTHHLHCAGPTPWHCNVRVYEFGGDNWTISTDEVDYSADFHPDGVHIVCTSGPEWGNTPDLFVMEYDGSNRTLLLTASDTIRNPRYSPDGNRIAMTLGNPTADPPDTSLWVYDISLETWTEIVPADGTDNYPSWSGVQIDGHDLIVFDSTRDSYPEYDSDIFIVRPDTQEIIYTLDTGASEVHPSFSPDGLSFVYSTIDADGDTELYVCEWSTGGTVTQLTDNDTYDGNPSWGWNW